MFLREREYIERKYFSTKDSFLFSSGVFIIQKNFLFLNVKESEDEQERAKASIPAIGLRIADRILWYAAEENLGQCSKE